MAFQVTNQKTGHSFSVENTETVLDAAMRQSRAFSYSCRSGSCGSCKARLISGEVDPGDYAARSPRAQKLPETFCSAKPNPAATL